MTLSDQFRVKSDAVKYDSNLCVWSLKPGVWCFQVIQQKPNKKTPPEFVLRHVPKNPPPGIESTNQPTNQPNQSTQPTNQPTNPPTHPTNQPTNQPTTGIPKLGTDQHLWNGGVRIGSYRCLGILLASAAPHGREMVLVGWWLVEQWKPMKISVYI